jgi:hypothetical protein
MFAHRCDTRRRSTRTCGHAAETATFEVLYERPDFWVTNREDGPSRWVPTLADLLVLDTEPTMRRLLALSTALLVLGVVLAACGADPTPDGPSVPDPAPAEDPDPAEQPQVPGDPATAPDPDLERVEVFHVRTSVDWHWVEAEVVHLDPGEDLPLAVMQHLFGAAPLDPELSSAAPAITVLGVDLDGSVLVVDVDAAMRDTSGSSLQESAFSQQFAHTASALGGVTAARLTIAGAPIDELWGHLDWSVPVEPDPFALSPITIAEPTHDATIPSGTVQVHGEATVFEATFWLRLIDADGTVVEEVTVMASTGGPERGTWSHTFEIADPGAYTIEAEEPDMSDGEGRAPLVTTRSITVG